MPEQVRTARDAPILSTTDASALSAAGRETKGFSSDEARDPALIEETIITPRAGWPALGLMDLVHYRDLLVQLTLRNIKVRYKQTLLGVLWAVLQPVLLTLVFAFSLRQLIPMASRQVPYPVFVLSGMLPWVFFQTAVTAAANSVVSSEQLVTKVYLPRLAIPFSAIAAALIDLGISFVVLVGMMVWYAHIDPVLSGDGTGDGISPSVSVLLLPLAVVLLVVAATGMGTLLAALTVSYRDFRHAVTFLLPAWMIATPTIFLENQSGGLARLNPMTAPIDFFRSVTLGLPVPWQSVLYAVAFNSVLCLVGLYYFRRVEDSFADVI